MQEEVKWWRKNKIPEIEDEGEARSRDQNIEAEGNKEVLKVERTTQKKVQA